MFAFKRTLWHGVQKDDWKCVYGYTAKCKKGKGQFHFKRMEFKVGICCNEIQYNCVVLKTSLSETCRSFCSFLSQLWNKTRLHCLTSFPTAVLDAPEDPFSSRQTDSSEVMIPNSWVESGLQRNRDLSFTRTDKGVFSRPARSFITEEILEALRKADRKGRDVVIGLSNACCKWGCSKSEISSLC